MMTDMFVRSLGAAVPGPVREWVAGHREPDLPDVEVSPQLIAKWLLDETLLQTEVARGRMRLPSTDFRRRLRGELEDGLDLFADQGWLTDPRSYHVAPPPPSNVQRVDKWHGGLRHERVRWASDYEPHADEPGRDRWLDYSRNRTAEVRLLQHDGAPRPWIICQNGYRTGVPAIDFPTFDVWRLHNELGLNVAVNVAPMHGSRREGLSGDRVLFSGAMNIVHLGAQAVWDVRRLAAWLRTEHDAPSVGLWGISLGGFIVSLTASLESDIDLVIAGVPEPDLIRGMRRNVEGLLPPFYEQWGLSWTALERVTRVVSPLEIDPLVPHDRRFIFAGLVDRWVRPGNVRALWTHWDEPAICWYPGSHLSFGREPEVQLFVDEALGLLSESSPSPPRV